MSYPRLKIDYPDGTDEIVQVRPRDVLAFEAHFQVPYLSVWVNAQMAFAEVPDISDQDASELDAATVAEVERGLRKVDAAIQTTHLYFLGWAAKTAGKAEPFEEWLDLIDDVSYVPGSAVEDVPLEKGGSTPTLPPTPPSPSTPES